MQRNDKNILPRMVKATGDWADVKEAYYTECIKCGRGMLHFMGEDPGFQRPVCRPCVDYDYAGEPGRPSRSRCGCGRGKACMDGLCGYCRWSPPREDQLFEAYVKKQQRW